jgi:hypothetical protein
MSLILFLLTIALIGIIGWGIQSVMVELAKPYPRRITVDTAYAKAPQSR